MNEGREFNIYSAKDELAGRFMQPLFMEADEIAIRWFKDVLNNTRLWKDNASQFNLYKIGTYNENTGVINGLLGVEMIAGGQSVKEE